MRRSMIVTAIAASVSMTAWGGSASAQSVELYVGPPSYGPYYRAYRSYGYGPRVYGYYYGPSERHLRRPNDYRTGSRGWWRQMDRSGRGGHQE